MVNSDLGPFLHRLAIVHPWRTDKQTDDNYDKGSTLSLHWTNKVFYN